jgi:hypothetical protein
MQVEIHPNFQHEQMWAYFFVSIFLFIVWITDAKTLNLLDRVILMGVSCQSPKTLSDLIICLSVCTFITS